MLLFIWNSHLSGNLPFLSANLRTLYLTFISSTSVIISFLTDIYHYWQGGLGNVVDLMGNAVAAKNTGILLIK